MRMLKQGVVTASLLLTAIVVLNLARIGRLPAQGRGAGDGQPMGRNGDVDCDGQINISDPIVLLNWLFGNGPEPCAIAQTDTCCTELRADIAALRATVDSLVARVPGPNDLVVVSKELRSVPVGTQVLVDVPDDKRFVLTSTRVISNGGRGSVVSILNGIPAEPSPGGLSGQIVMWTSGVAFPLGADVGLTVQDVPLETGLVFLSGYLAGE